MTKTTRGRKSTTRVVRAKASARRRPSEIEPESSTGKAPPARFPDAERKAETEAGGANESSNRPALSTSVTGWNRAVLESARVRSRLKADRGQPRAEDSDKSGAISRPSVEA